MTKSFDLSLQPEVVENRSSRSCFQLGEMGIIPNLNQLGMLHKFGET
jgi:hypothetical protein